jgi:hypothetical protein
MMKADAYLREHEASRMPVLEIPNEAQHAS